MTSRPAFVGLRSLWSTVLAGLLGLTMWLGAPLAHASTGRAEGFAVEQATSTHVIGRVTLRFEPDLDDEAEMLAANIPAWWSEIERPLARDVDDTLRITLVDHAGRVAEATGMPHWVAGVARSETGDIVIARHGPDGARTDLEHLLKHEMAHVVLHRASGGADVPRWFHEGIAESVAGGISLGRAQTLASAVFGPGVPDMERLEAQFHGSDGQDAAVAYAAARDLVAFLRAQGEDGVKLRQAMSELRRGESFEAAIARAYGKPLAELVQVWRAGLPARFVWYPMVAGGGLPLALVFPLVLVAWIRKRREVKRGWDRLAREDELMFDHEPGPTTIFTPA